MTEWDLVVVGSGPAGAAAAIGALRTRSCLRVLLLDRSDFPRDKACGDGIAPQVFDLLEQYAVTGLVADQVPVHDLRLDRGSTSVRRRMRRPAWVVPRAVFDERLHRAAVAAGAVPHRGQVRSIEAEPAGVRVQLTGSEQQPVLGEVLVGADGAHSVVARSLADRREPRRTAQTRTAFALRGYAPTPPARRGEQVIVFGDTRQPSYAWSFDRGDGTANVGYGELLHADRPPPTRRLLLEQLERLLPGATAGGHGWRGHHLPLSPWRWRPQPGRVLLAGDAARLINPLTGEGIYYAVLTGLLAGASAAEAVGDGNPADAGRRYRAAVAPHFRAHLPSTGLAARLTTADPVLAAGLRAAGADQRVFDDLVEMGLAGGTLTPRLLAGLAREAVKARG